MSRISPIILVAVAMTVAAWAGPTWCLAQPAADPDSTAVDSTAAEGGAQTESPAEPEKPAPAVKNPRVAIEVSVDSENGQETKLGRIVIELHRRDAPKHVANFLKLVREGFYEGTTFHRIVPAFVIQGGDLVSKRNWQSTRVGTGSDGPEYTVPAEIGAKHVRGAVAAARTQDAVNPNKESSPSQFYICLADLPALDRMGYSVFGQVVEGMDVVDKIARVKNSGPPKNQALQKVHMTSVKVME